jgi:FtsP/CotA-like multicopper oxidase with cupredoxin domain
MLSSKFKKIRRFLALGLVLIFIMSPVTGGLTAPADHNPIPSTGIVCTTNPSATFTLTALEGYISMTDGNTIYMWSFSEGMDDFQYPGPILCVNQGDTVTVVLHNTLPQDVSIIFPGQTDVQANGLPAQPQFDGAQLTSLAPVAAANGGTMTYSFVAAEPGTYMYQSGTNPGLQAQMGLVGALIVRPAMGANFAYNSADTEFKAGNEYLLMLGEIDPLMHQAIERGETFDMTQYQARYFTINGRTFPDTLAPNGASWLPTQPYGSLAHIHPYNNDSLSPAYNPLPALARYIGIGAADYPFHPHAFNSRIIARDGRLRKGPGGEDISGERFSIPIGPGQTTDALFQWTDTSNWDADAAPIPVELPGDQNMVLGPFWGGSPYLGGQNALPTGTASFNQCGEFYHIAHNHALQQITGWGVVLIGQVTFTRIDPPLPNNCP